MAQAEAAGRVGDAGGQHGSAHRLLDRGGDPGGEGPPAGIGHHASGGVAGTPIASPIPCRHSGLSSPGPGAVAPCPSLPPERDMELSHLPQLVLERFQQAVQQQRVPVLVAFAGTHGQNRWGSLPLPGLRSPLRSPTSLPSTFRYRNCKGGESLMLGRGTHSDIRGQIAEEGVDLGRAHVAWMPTPMERQPPQQRSCLQARETGHRLSVAVITTAFSAPVSLAFPRRGRWFFWPPPSSPCGWRRRWPGDRTWDAPGPALRQIRSGELRRSGKPAPSGSGLDE